MGILHGHLHDNVRGEMLQRFRTGALDTLVVSDLVSRGLDLPNVDAVFNIGLPGNPVMYAHRAGRTARMGAQGMVMTIIEPSMVGVLKGFEQDLGVKIMVG